MKRSSKAESKESGKYAPLIQQFINLEIEWKILKDSRGGRNKPPAVDASDNISSSILLAYLDRAVLDKSPTGLVSYLQHRKSPSLSIVVRNCDVAVEEILRDRRAAIISGKLKGRRLFQASEEDSDLKEEISQSDWLNNMAQERKVMVVNDPNSIHGGKRIRRSLGGEDDDSTSVVSDQSLSRSFSDSSVSEEKVVVAVVEEEKRGGADGNQRGGDRGYMVSNGWFAFVLILAILGLISMSCNGRFVEVSDEFMILVPT
ncbi:hypothetical protein OROGR_029192 [Orobanche gracilis]